METTRKSRTILPRGKLIIMDWAFSAISRETTVILPDVMRRARASIQPSAFLSIMQAMIFIMLRSVLRRDSAMTTASDYWKMIREMTFIGEEPWSRAQP